MSRTTRFLSRLCVAGGLAAYAERRRRREGKPVVTILAYHRIGTPEAGPAGLDERVVSASPAGFDRQMQYLRSRHEVLSFDDLVDRVHADRPIPTNAAVVTFDDGYRDNFDLAYPILRRHGLPATIFLTTGFVGSTQRLWWDELHAAIAGCNSRRVGIPGLGEVSLGSRGSRRRVMETLRRQWKNIPDSELRASLDKTSSALGGGAAPGRHERVSLSWDEVREMRGHGIGFGAHTHTHPILTRVSAAAGEREISVSRTTLERELGVPPRFFAYPNGERGDFDAGTRDLLIRNGFEAAVTLVPGSNPLAGQRTDLFELRRHFVGADDHAVFVAKLSGALELLAAPFRRIAERQPRPPGKARLDGR